MSEANQGRSGSSRVNGQFTTVSFHKGLVHWVRSLQDESGKAIYERTATLFCFFLFFLNIIKTDKPGRKRNNYILACVTAAAETARNPAARSAPKGSFDELFIHSFIYLFICSHVLVRSPWTVILFHASLSFFVLKWWLTVLTCDCASWKMSEYLPTPLGMDENIHLSSYPSIYSSIHPSTVSTHLSISLSTHLSIIHL